MKRAIALICFLLYAGTAFAFPEACRKKNTATKVSFRVLNASTGADIASATGLDCETRGYDDSTTPGTYADVAGTEHTDGTSTDAYDIPLTAGEMNFDYIDLRCKSSSSNAITYGITFNTKYGCQDIAAVALANVTQWNSSNVASPTNAGYPLIDIHSGTGTNQLQVAGGLVGIAASGIPYNAAAARGTAQSVTAGPPSTLVMAASESFADNELRYNTMVTVVSATAGAGQSSCICGNTGSSDTLTLCDPWATLPTGTITYLLRSAPNCVALRPTTIGNTLDVAATGEAGLDLSNTKAGTDWLTATGLATSAVNEIVDQVWDELQSDHATSGTMGAGQSSSGSSGASTFRAW